MPYWLCLPFTIMFASKLYRMKLKFSGISDCEKNFSALKVHGKHFNDHEIRAFVPTAKRQQNINTKVSPKTITENILKLGILYVGRFLRILYMTPGNDCLIGPLPKIKQFGIQHRLLRTNGFGIYQYATSY